MKCPKCKSRMVPERVVTPNKSLYQAHCLFCGTCVDEQSLRNRAKSLNVKDAKKLFSTRMTLT